MRIQVYHVHIPALSTVGYGEGYDPRTGRSPSSGIIGPCGTWAEPYRNATEPVYVEVEPWQIVEGR